MEILVISGLSGAGKSCAASCLEDIGYYTVDNMPAAIIPKFAEFSAESDGRYDRVALVNDIRGGVDSFQELLEVIDRLREGGTVCRLLYLEADTQSIIKRYKETRRRHPLMESGATIEDAVKRETELLRPLRERADFVIDTTQLSAAKLRGELYRLFAEKARARRRSVLRKGGRGTGRSRSCRPPRRRRRARRCPQGFRRRRKRSSSRWRCCQGPRR